MKEADFDFCDVYGNVCFENSMTDVALKENCNCPMECETIRYSSYHVSSPFNPEVLCSRQTGGLMEEFYRNKHPPHFVRNLLKFTGDNVTSDAYEICKRNIQYRAEVTFQLATDIMSVTVLSRRLSFFDKLSDFGNNKTSLLSFIIF